MYATANRQEIDDESSTARETELSIIVPTFNESQNVSELVDLVRRALQGVKWELIFVDDDSKDGTIAIARHEAQQAANIRLIHRIGRRGLSSAVVEGIQASTAPYIAVMDADLQHDETLLPRMLQRLKTNDADIVVGSRYIDGGGISDWSESRAGISRFATKLAQTVLKVELTDPMSGFFALRRDVFDKAVRHLSVQGYKILLDILASLPEKAKVVELPYVFRSRLHGESKFDSAATWQYLMLLADKLVGHILPVRFVVFMLVGGTGVFVHMGVLAVLFRGLAMPFLYGQIIAMVAAMTFNYFANNVITYRDRRRKGWGLLVGLLTFYIICSLGAVANVGIANFAFGHQYSWWLSGFAGILVGAVWNYAASSVFTWRKA